MVGEEGRGIRTIIDMVAGNRMYCAVSSAGISGIPSRTTLPSLAVRRERVMRFLRIVEQLFVAQGPDRIDRADPLSRDGAGEQRHEIENQRQNQKRPHQIDGNAQEKHIMEQSKSNSFSKIIQSSKRSRSDKKLGGVCGGLAKHSDLPSWFFRAVFIFMRAIPPCR